jgi:hypothetical protein
LRLIAAASRAGHWEVVFAACSRLESAGHAAAWSTCHRAASGAARHLLAVLQQAATQPLDQAPTGGVWSHAIPFLGHRAIATALAARLLPKVACGPVSLDVAAELRRRGLVRELLQQVAELAEVAGRAGAAAGGTAGAGQAAEHKSCEGMVLNAAVLALDCVAEFVPELLRGSGAMPLMERLMQVGGPAALTASCATWCLPWVCTV